MRTPCIATQRAERVAVGVLVGDEAEALAPRGSRRGPARVPRSRRRDHLALVLRRRRSMRRLEPRGALGGVVEDERRAPACASSAARAAIVRLQEAVGRRQARPASPCCSSGGPEHADVDARVAEVRAGLHVGHGDEADAWVLEIVGRRRRRATSRTASSTRRMRAPPELILTALGAIATTTAASSRSTCLRLEDLEHVALLDVLVVGEHDAALVAGRDLAGVVVEAPQRVDRRRRR